MTHFPEEQRRAVEYVFTRRRGANTAHTQMVEYV